MIFQDFLLFEELSPLENASLAAAFVLPAERSRIVAGAGHWLTRFGLSNTERRTVASFSGGERQRIAVARALAGGPAVILADEPTASLDRANADRLSEDLTRIARDEGRTLIAVTHDMNLADRLDRVITLGDGRIVDDIHV
jgi:putative ABC transport system ATP-binding protein